MCERIILDTACYPDAHTVLAQLRDELRHHGGSLRLGDISWIRTESWRQLAAQTFDNPEALSWLPRLRSVDVGCAGDEVTSRVEEEIARQ